MIIYGAMYSFNKNEEKDELISLHKTKEGAIEDLKKHKETAEKAYSECRINNLKYYNEFMQNCEWSVCEYELLD